MSDTELIVPVEVHALLVNEKVRTLHPFYRTTPSFDHMLGTEPEAGRGAAEPEPFTGGKDVSTDDTFEGVHVQWQLPEALTEGFVDESTGRTDYPLVPNRWLVVRYSQVRGVGKAVGWVVHSDYLYSDDDGDLWDGQGTINSFLDLRGETPQVDWLGRLHALADGPWHEPEARELFLTAVGAGLPTFAAYQPYHENVFSLHDDLQDLRDPSQGDSYPPDATLSYLVAGWYSDPAEDILAKAADIPGLLPPGSAGTPADVVAALGWTVAGRTATVTGGLGTDAPHGVESILDNDEGTYYRSENAPATGDRITVDLGSVQQLTSLRVLLGDPDGQHLLPKVRVQTSVDNENWPAQYHQDYEAGTPVIDYRPQTPFEARYLRLYILEAGAEPLCVRTFHSTAAPKELSRTLYSGTALGLDWKRFGQAPDDERPVDAPRIKIALGHSTGEAASALVHRQTRSPRTARLFSALYHGTLDTFDGAAGERDLEETTHRSWFAGSDGGYTWQIVPRPTDGPDASRTPRGTDPAPDWLDQLNSDQGAYDEALNDLSAGQWRLWSLYWLRHLPEGQRPADLPDDFDAACDWQLEPANDGLATSVAADLARVAGLREKIPQTGDGQDPQEAIDAWAARKGLAEHLRLKRLPQDSFYKPADPVLLVEGAGGGTTPLARDSDNPLPCRLPSDLLRRARIGETWTAPPTTPPDPGTTGLPAPCAALLKEFALLDQAARTPDAGRTALHTLTENPATHAEGPLAEYTAPWHQPWLPMLLTWKVSFFPTPYRTGEDYHWSFQAPDPASGLDSYSYTWNGDGTLPADFESEGDVLNRLFRGRSYLAPTTVFVARAQLARYLATYPGADAAGLATLRQDLVELDVLSQTLDGFNDWLLQLDGGAQVPTEGTVAALTGEQNHVPDGAAGPHQQRFQPVRAGQFFFTDLRIVDRFGRIADLVTSGAGGNWYDQYPVRAASVTPSRDLYTRPELINPERFIQLPPRLLQHTRLAFTPVPAAPAAAPVPAAAPAPGAPADPVPTQGEGSPVAGWLLANYLDQTLGVYGPAGQALGELRVITTSEATRETRYNPLPHSPYTGPDDRRFTDHHPQLAAFLTALLGHPADAFEGLLATIDTSLRTTVDPAPEDDHLPVRLIGRPVALIRADLDLQLQGPPLTDPSWHNILPRPEEDEEGQPDYTDDTWAIRLGDPYDLDDGLIGYYSADPDQDVDYCRLRAVHPVGDSDYIRPVTNGEDLALPARATGRTIRHVTLLAHPHVPVHATTDILPVHSLRLDADLVHQALADIRASFRLNPLLAVTRSARTDATVPGGHGISTPQAGPVGPVGGFRNTPEDDALVIPPLSARYGTWTWAQPQATDTEDLDWDERGLIPADHLTHPDDPNPTARAGYLQLHPATPDPEAEPTPQP
ncbi:discoidin domain-containing protein [Kitasatospora sp. NPDC056446]|uniref:discoidin domain-containing protein n=1 Tax=Kitasatospora sp. NPDC056446 TaxID=3345819 RepID=UPI00367BAEA3